ncbi:hypothetical protein ABC347_07950 [Sphingomonas sp. 1P06PA]|uniref:hypothetical protein n=1 Tax=Sphingomonas sp. 1P06PA TaxID=554121 RepID=UPI0039A45C0E
MTARTPWTAQRTRDAEIARMPMANVSRSEAIGTPLITALFLVIGIFALVIGG